MWRDAGSHVQLHYIAVVQRMLASDALAVAHACAPDLGDSQRLGEFAMHDTRQVFDVANGFLRRESASFKS